MICFALLSLISLVSSNVSFGQTASHEEVPDASSPPVRVMSFNIRYGTAEDGINRWENRQEFLVETILAFDPDLLGTQETLATQRDFLAGRLSGYEVVAAGRQDGQNAGEMTAVFFRKSRFKKLAGGHFWLSETPDTIGSKGWDAALPRMATWVKLQDLQAPKSKPVLLLNTHFDHRGVQARIQAARLIRQQLGVLGKDCRLIATGDFNADEGSEPHQALFGEADDDQPSLVDTYRAFHTEIGTNQTDLQPGTFSGFQATAASPRRIDWIGCSEDWEVRLAGIDRTARRGRSPSDHFPVTAVLRRKPSRPTLRVLCYNIHHGRGVDGQVDLLRLAKVIRATDADLVALQEVDNKTGRTNQVDQTAELARLTGLFGVFGKAIDYDGGEYGQAVLARFPIGKGTVHTLPGTPAQEQRIAFEVRINCKWPQKQTADLPAPQNAQRHQLAFVTTHLHHRNAQFREQQVAKLNQLFTQAKHEVILAGDLNATPESQAMGQFEKGWTVATAEPELLTYPASKPTKQIDYILFRSARLRSLSAEVLNEAVASDHRPVLAVLELLPR